jgi:hypothetical protein
MPFPTSRFKHSLFASSLDDQGRSRRDGRDNTQLTSPFDVVNPCP